MINNFILSSHDQGVLKSMILAGVISFYVDQVKNFNKCKSKGLNKFFILILHFFHHISYTFIHFSFLFNDKRLLILSLILIGLTVIHWSLNSNKCFATQYYNKTCEFDESKPMKVFTNRKNQTLFDKYYAIFYIIILIIKLYFIFKNIAL